MESFNQYEPKRENRFIVDLPKIFGIDEWVINSVTMPKYSCYSTPKGWFYRWDTIKITFKDLVDPSTSEKLYKLIPYPELTEQTLPKFTFTISVLDPTGVTVEKWRIEDCTIFYLDFGQDMTYGSDEFKEPSITVMPARCILES